MTSLLTRDEHIARAMLMGREYDEEDGTYCSDDDCADDWVIDCMTFEVVPWLNFSTEELHDFKHRKKWERHD